MEIVARLDGADLPAPERVIPPELERAVTTATLLLEREAKKRTPVGVTGTARQSIGHEVRRGRALQRGASIRAELGSPQRHVTVLERGRRAGATQPPTDALVLWVRRRLGIADPEEARSVAFLVARKIGREGTEAVEMFKEAVEENLPRVQRIFEASGVRITVRFATEGA